MLPLLFRTMNISILGTRGVPARYGGFETLADQLSTRLVRRGHQVTVYCRKPFVAPDDEFDHRIRRVILPTISNESTRVRIARRGPDLTLAEARRPRSRFQ